jgi:hypothetical protein
MFSTKGKDMPSTAVLQARTVAGQPLDAQSVAKLYDTDFYAWANVNAQLLREGKYDQIDVSHLIEEVEDMGKSEFRALESHVQIVLMHLLKWQFQPVKRTASWQQSIKNGRRSVAKLLRDNPSFLPKLQGVMQEEYPAALENAAFETGLPESSFPADCSYSVESVTDENSLPQ